MLCRRPLSKPSDSGKAKPPRLSRCVDQSANQVLFKDRLKQAIALSRRNDQMQAVLLLNLDRFKTINDSLGYTAGDRLLQSVAQRLGSCVRESDTVARFGGDEFAVLLTQIPRAQDAANVASAIKNALDQAFLFEDQEIFVSSSIGISLYPPDGRDTAGLLKNAGTALDRAKSLGGNVYQFYTAGGTTRALKQLVLESNLRPGLERAEFVVQYQPQVDIRGFHLVGMEALVRWHHPSLGLLYPNEFVPLAEESGLIIALGDWVTRTACAQNKAWQDAGPRAVANVSELLRPSISTTDVHRRCCGYFEGDESGSTLARTGVD